MASNFKHLEYLPLDEDNLIINDNPTSNLKSKSCLNLGFVALNALTRSLNITTINKNSFNTGTTFLDLSYILENLLITTLNINCISNPSNTQLTNHYRNYSSKINNNKILPSFSYCQNLTFTNFKTWAGFYGTLSYYINLLEEYKEYLTPSEVIHEAYTSLFEYSKNVAYNAFLNKNTNDYKLISEFYREGLELGKKEEKETDKAIYNLSINIILASPFVKEIFNELKFYEKWLFEVLEWKAEEERNKNKELFIIDNPSTNEQRAINTLLKVAKSIYELGFGAGGFSNLAASFIRQEYSSNLDSLMNVLAIERTESTYVDLEFEVKTPTEILVVKFLDNVSKFRTSYDFKKASNIILETFCLPGGYALLLVSLSNMLFNRAYILCYRNINNNSDLLSSDVYKRIRYLLGLGCILLIKSGLPHAQIIASNTLKTFKIYLTDINPNNLTDSAI